jgi:HSP20 family protein
MAVSSLSTAKKEAILSSMSGLVRNGQGTQQQLADPRATAWSPLQGLFGFDPFDRIMRANWEFGFDVARNDHGYEVEVPVPGFNAGNVEVTLKDGIISINGKNDRRNFSRSFTVPEDVDPDRIQAKVVDGMLTIALERLPEAQPKRIAVS